MIHAVAHPDANIIFGAVIDDEMGDEVRVTVIAAGFERWDDGKAGASAPPITTSSTASTNDTSIADVFAEPEADPDDDFDVPSFLQ